MFYSLKFVEQYHAERDAIQLIFSLIKTKAQHNHLAVGGHLQPHFQEADRFSLVFFFFFQKLILFPVIITYSKYYLTFSF